MDISHKALHTQDTIHTSNDAQEGGSDRQVGQWNRIEDPEMYPHNHGHLIYEKGAKTTQRKIDR